MKMKAYIQLAIYCLGSAGICSSESIVDVTLVTTGSITEFKYAVTNVGATPIIAFELLTNLMPVSFSSPTGWPEQTFPLPDGSFQLEWVQDSSGSPVRPGQRLDGFG
jgi:hypothetical protein